jgi:hypothetical protein
MSKRTNLTLLFVLVLLTSVAASARARLSPYAFSLRFGHALTSAASDREQDGLAGPVRRVKTETAKIAVKNGKPVEGARAVLETTTRRATALTTHTSSPRAERSRAKRSISTTTRATWSR